MTQIIKSASRLSAAEAATAEKIKSNFLLRGKIAATIDVLQKSGCTLQQAQQVVLNICKADGSHLQSSSSQPLLQAADKVIAAYRKSKGAEAIQDNPSKSWTTTAISDTAKNIQLPPPSKYQTYNQCLNDLINNLNVDPGLAAQHCKSVNADPGQKGPSEPKSGVKSASSVPYWIHTIKSMEGEISKPRLAGTTSFRNASDENDHIENMKAIYSMNAFTPFERHEAQRDQLRHKQILNASKKDSIPAWARIMLDKWD